MRDIALGLMEGVTLHVTYLSGRALPLREGVPVTLDDPTTYRLEIDIAATRIGYDDLARLMNDHVFAYEDAPLSDLVAERRTSRGWIPSIGGPIPVPDAWRVTRRAPRTSTGAAIRAR